jgi:predicted lipid carrier protein YhbT
MPAAHARSAAPPGDPVSQFFGMLARPGHLTTFEGESATLRFDVTDGGRFERWHLAVEDGDVTVSRRNSAADASVRIRRPDAEALVTGRLNAQAALLRGLIAVEGDIGVLMMFQRCLPGPPGSKGRVAPITSRMVTAERRAS